MNCPKCKSVQIKKQGYNTPYLCGQCGGMWVLDVESASFPTESHEKMTAGLGSIDHDKKTGVCPSGHGIMIRAKVDVDEPFYIEKCVACGGIWFDKDEWVRISENNLDKSLSSIWSKSWQRSQSKEKNRESFLNINRKLLGDQIFDAIIELSAELKDHPEKDRAIALLQQEIQ